MGGQELHFLRSQYPNGKCVQQKCDAKRHGLSCGVQECNTPMLLDLQSSSKKTEWNCLKGARVARENGEKWPQAKISSLAARGRFAKFKQGTKSDKQQSH